MLDGTDTIKLENLLESLALKDRSMVIRACRAVLLNAAPYDKDFLQAAFTFVDRRADGPWDEIDAYEYECASGPLMEASEELAQMAHDFQDRMPADFPA